MGCKPRPLMPPILRVATKGQRKFTVDRLVPTWENVSQTDRAEEFIPDMEGVVDDGGRFQIHWRERAQQPFLEPGKIISPFAGRSSRWRLCPNCRPMTVWV